MYFESRFSAGEELAKQLFDKYRYEDCAVIALSDGGVLVGEPVAQYLHTILMLMINESIEIPGENLTFGSVAQNGNFTYSDSLSKFEIEEYTNEFNGYLQDQKRQAFQKINRLIGDNGTIDLKMLMNRNIILISDSFDDSMNMQAIIDFLRPIKYNKLIAVSPIATVAAVNKLHMTVDEMHILDVKNNYYGANHYYEDNNIPDHEEVVSIISQNILNWR